MHRRLFSITQTNSLCGGGSMREGLKRLRLCPGWLAAWLIAACASSLPSAALAQDAPWLAGMPTAQQVVAAAKGVSERDNAAQASTALQMMDGIVQNLSAQPFNEQAVPPLVKRRLDEYRQARAEVDGREQARLPRQDCEGNDCEKYLYPRCQQQYYFSATYYRVVLDRHFSPDWQRTYVPRLRGTLWRDALNLPAGTSLPAGFGAAMPCTGQGQGQLVQEPGTMDYLVGALGGDDRRMALPLAGLVGVLALLLALHVRLLTRRLALDETDVLRLVGSSPRQLASITGWVLSPSKGFQTTRLTGNDSGVSSIAGTVVHDQFFIRSLEGEEREVKLTHVDMAVREGHQASAVWYEERGGRGPFLLLRNHSLHQTVYFGGLARRWLNMGPRWLWLMLLAVAVFVTYALAADEAQLSNTLPILFGLLAMPALIVFGALALALIFLRSRRLSKFRREVDERLVAELDRRAASQMGSGPYAGIQGVERV
jgi:hypothetical protein